MTASDTRRRPRPVEPTKPGTAAIYCRISEDREGLEVGVQRQEDDCRELATRLGYEVPEHLVFIENDVSASTRSSKPRPLYEQVMAAARRGEVQAILAYSNSRLTRRPMEVEDLIRLYEQTGVRVRTVVSGDDDLSTADGRMVARIKGNVDAAEAERTSERVKRARAQAVAEGRWRGGPRPYGFEHDGVTIRTEEAEVIRWATRNLLEGRTIRALVHDLNERGVPSTSGKKWATNALREMVLRPRNAGLISTGQRSHGNFQIHGKAVWEPLVPEDTWRALFDKLTHPDRATNGGKSSLTWLGSGVYRCGVPDPETGEVCGAPLRVARRGGTAASPEPPRWFYRCPDRAHLAIAQPKLDAYVLGQVADLVRDPRIIAALSPKGVDLEPDRQAVAVLRQRLRQTDLDYDNDLINAQRHSVKTAKLSAEIAVIEKRMAQAAQRGTSSPILAAVDPGDALLSAPIDIQRAVLATVVRVRVTQSRPEARGKRLTDDLLRERVHIEPALAATGEA
ncbi:recombinase family protein [Microbacterium sp. KSW4-16]|uniref:recombinase family protein n=1 Tax=Microbacterium aurugineum TaxID=2851642 RepID=UPI0020BE7974|nr:recombinase family protein [Microbacterium aurugineum]MCK8468084.1 recombinase family protein [Microbacterium aurugineum]